MANDAPANAVILRPIPRDEVHALPGLVHRNPPWASFLVGTLVLAYAVVSALRADWTTGSPALWVLSIGLLAWVPVGVAAVWRRGLEDRSNDALLARSAAPGARSGAGAQSTLRIRDLNPLDAVAGLLLVVVLCAASAIWMTTEFGVGTVLVTAIAAIIVLLCARMALPTLRSSWRFGRCSIHTPELPLRAGGQHTLTLSSDRGLSLTPARLRLSYFWQQRHGGAENGFYQRRSSWTAEAQCSAGAPTIECRIEFAPDAPATAQYEQGHWCLEVHGTDPRRPMRALFVLPVGATGATDGAAARGRGAQATS